MDGTFLAEVAEKGRYLREETEKMPHVQSVAGMGMMLGIALDTESKPIISRLLEKGLMVLSAKEKIRLLPPLTITREELKQGLAILRETLENI